MKQRIDEVAQRRRKRLLKTGWLDLKAWLNEEGERQGALPMVIWSRFHRGRYARSLAVKRLNPRVIMVKPI